MAHYEEGSVGDCVHGGDGTRGAQGGELEEGGEGG